MADLHASYRAIFDELDWAIPGSPLDAASQWPQDADTHNYIMVIQGRCGSTWFGDLLIKSKRLGLPREWFNTPGMISYARKFEAGSLSDYLVAVAGRTKPMAMQIDAMRLFLLEAAIDFETSFIDAGFRWIDLRRTNLLAQAFSFARARQTAHWHGQGQPDVEVDTQEVWKMITHIVQYEQAIDAWYTRHEIVPLRLTYEDLCSDMELSFARLDRFVSRHGVIGEIPDFQSRFNKLSANTDVQLLDFYNRFGPAYEAVLNKRAQIDPATIVALSAQFD